LKRTPHIQDVIGATKLLVTEKSPTTSRHNDISLAKDSTRLLLAGGGITGPRGYKVDVARRVRTRVGGRAKVPSRRSIGLSGPLPSMKKDGQGGRNSEFCTQDWRRWNEKRRKANAGSGSAQLKCQIGRLRKVAKHFQPEIDACVASLVKLGEIISNPERTTHTGKAEIRKRRRRRSCEKRRAKRKLARRLSLTSVLAQRALAVAAEERVQRLADDLEISRRRKVEELTVVVMPPLPPPPPPPPRPPAQFGHLIPRDGVEDATGLPWPRCHTGWFCPGPVTHCVKQFSVSSHRYGEGGRAEAVGTHRSTDILDEEGPRAGGSRESSRATGAHSAEPD